MVVAGCSLVTLGGGMLTLPPRHVVYKLVDFEAAYDDRT